MKKIINLAILLVLLVSCRNTNYTPKEGFVPDEETAIKIAEAVWLPIYGEEVLMQRPYEVRLENGTWIIEGILHEKPNESVKGGVAYIEINQEDAKITKVSHGK